MLKDRKSRASLLLALIFLGYGWLVFATLTPHLPSRKAPLQFYATQLRNDLKWVVISAIASARSSISLQIYGLSDPDVLNLLEQKSNEGVEVKIFFDRKASKKLPPFALAFPVQAGGLMHRKILVIDGKLTLIGTANFTPHSLKMHDNLVVGIWDRAVATFFEEAIGETATFALGEAQLQGFFLPDFSGEALARLCSSIQAAKASVECAMFTLTHPRVVEELIAAKQRGAKVSVVLDRYTALGASLKAVNALKAAGVNVRVSRGNQLLHHKWALIDGKTLVMGSANWTRAAFSKNQDCLLFVSGLPLKQQRRLQRLWSKVASASEKG